MDKRQGMVDQLLMRGHASMDELLEASFGEWPPRGLVIVLPNEQRVNLVQHVKGITPESNLWDVFRTRLLAGGQATLGGERTIFMNPLSIGNQISTLGHEAAHILQGDYFYRSDTVLGARFAQDEWQKPACESAEIGEALTGAHTNDHVLMKAFRAVAKYAGLGGNYNYLKDGIEIQARLHEALIAGYPHWPQLPQNKTELLCALSGLGMIMPAAVRRELDAEPGIADIRAQFRAPMHIPLVNRTFIDDLHFLQINLTQTGREKFWRDTLPELYADLIEMYGDLRGRQRLGMGQNTRINARLQFNDDLSQIRALPWKRKEFDDGCVVAYIQTSKWPPIECENLLTELHNTGFQVSAQAVPGSNDQRYDFIMVCGDESLNRLAELTGRDLSANKPAPAATAAAGRPRHG